jgi:hypothetical protein
MSRLKDPSERKIKDSKSEPDLLNCPLGGRERCEHLPVWAILEMFKNQKGSAKQGRG